jgi:hypothetical protein
MHCWRASVQETGAWFGRDEFWAARKRERGSPKVLIELESVNASMSLRSSEGESGKGRRAKDEKKIKPIDSWMMSATLARLLVPTSQTVQTSRYADDAGHSYPSVTASTVVPCFSGHIPRHTYPFKVCSSIIGVGCPSHDSGTSPSARHGIETTSSSCYTTAR